MRRAEVDDAKYIVVGYREAARTQAKLLAGRGDPGHRDDANNRLRQGERSKLHDLGTVIR
jgi:hypothetical protein